METTEDRGCGAGLWRQQKTEGVETVNGDNRRQRVWSRSVETTEDRGFGAGLWRQQCN